MSEALNEALDDIIRVGKRLQEEGLDAHAAFTIAHMLWAQTRFPDIDDDDDEDEITGPHQAWYGEN